MAFWTPPSNNQINSNTNPFRSLTTQQMRQKLFEEKNSGLRSFKDAITNYVKYEMGNASGTDEKKQVRQDEKELLMLHGALSAGDKKKAQRIFDQMDTALQDIVPQSLYPMLEAALVAPPKVELMASIPGDLEKMILTGKYKVVFSAPSKLAVGSQFQVVEMPKVKAGEDRYRMVVVSDPKKKPMTILAYFGSHPSAEGALKFGKNRNLVENLEEGAGEDLAKKVKDKGTYLGNDKKFGRAFFEMDGSLYVIPKGKDGKSAMSLGSMEVKSNQKMVKGLVKEETELEEAVKVGDTVHLGHGTKGGTGVVGKVTKIEGGMVHIKNDNGDTFKGPLNRATLRESIELNEKIKYDPCALYLVYDGQILGSYKTKKEALRDSAGRGEVKTWCELTPKERKQVSESVELDEMRPHGMNLSVGNIQDTPSMKRYYAKLAAEREARANKPKPSDDLKGGKRPEKKLESVEHLDELKTSTIRSYVKKAQDDNQKRAMRIVDRDRLDLVHGSEMRKLRKRGRGVARAKAELDLRKIMKRESVKLDEAEKDHEYSMARAQLSTIQKAVVNLMKKMKGEGNLEAWVQSKITKAADYIDSVSDYIDSGEHEIEEVFGGIKRYIKSANKDISKWDQKDRIAYQQLQNKKGPESRPLGAGFIRRAKAAKLKKQRRETRVEDWQKVNRKDNVDGLSQKAVDAYRRENPGSKLQTAVTEKNPKGKRAARRASFCSRMSGMKDKLTSSETANDPDSRINKALRRWNC